MIVVGILEGKVAGPLRISLGSGDFGTIFIGRDRRFPAHIAKMFLGSGFFVGCWAVVLSGVVENQDTAVAEWDPKFTVQGWGRDLQQLVEVIRGHTIASSGAF